MVWRGAISLVSADQGQYGSISRRSGEGRRVDRDLQVQLRRHWNA